MIGWLAQYFLPSPHSRTELQTATLQIAAGLNGTPELVAPVRSLDSGKNTLVTSLSD